MAGVGWVAVLAWLGVGLLGWGVPLFAGLLLAVPAAVLSSRATLGRAARRAGLFLTVDETTPAPILRAFRRRIAAPLADVPKSPVASGPLLGIAVESGEGD